MVVRVQKTAAGLGVTMTPEMIRMWGLQEGSEIELQPIEGASGHRYATRDEALDAFERTLPLHENTYKDLAK